jgi:hypothetical protein
MQGGPTASSDRMMPMERLLFWALFVAGMGLAAWLPLKSEFPDLGARIAHMTMVARK